MCVCNYVASTNHKMVSVMIDLEVWHKARVYRRLDTCKKFKEKNLVAVPCF